jgi:cytochrome c oxidase subunit II
MARPLAIVIWAIAIIIVGLFVWSERWLPASISAHSHAIDTQFKITLAVIGIGFFLAHAALGVAIWRYRAAMGRRAAHWPGNSPAEIVWTVIIAVIFIALAITGQRVWAQLRLNQAPADALQIEVTAQQFVWRFRYPGADGRFGSTSPRLFNDADTSIGARPGPLGIDPRDPSGNDDIVTSTLVIPAGRPINLTLLAKDVTHDFYVPALRLKHDAVPGMSINLHFKALKEGRYEIACAELCGLLHHQMRAYLEVRTQIDYESWLKENSKQTK